MKDFLEEEGFILKSPRSVIKQALQYGIIQDGHTWIKALESRKIILTDYSDRANEKSFF